MRKRKVKSARGVEIHRTKDGTEGLFPQGNVTTIGAEWSEN